MNNLTIALVAHDNRKKDLLAWVEHNIHILSEHKLVCTGTTGKLVQDLFDKYEYNTEIIRLKSGPLGGDQQLGAMIADDKISLLVFLSDDMSAQPHDVDVKALSRLVRIYNIPNANNRSSADFIITSPLFVDDTYEKEVIDYSSYLNRNL